MKKILDTVDVVKAMIASDIKIIQYRDKTERQIQ